MLELIKLTDSVEVTQGESQAYHFWALWPVHKKASQVFNLRGFY